MLSSNNFVLKQLCYSGPVPISGYIFLLLANTHQSSLKVWRVGLTELELARLIVSISIVKPLISSLIIIEKGLTPYVRALWSDTALTQVQHTRRLMCCTCASAVSDHNALTCGINPLNNIQPPTSRNTMRWLPT